MEALLLDGWTVKGISMDFIGTAPLVRSLEDVSRSRFIYTHIWIAEGRWKRWIEEASVPRTPDFYAIKRNWNQIATDYTVATPGGK